MGLGLVSCLHYSIHPPLVRGKHINALSHPLEQDNDRFVHFFKCRYMEESGHSASNNSRSSHNVGRLGNLIRVSYSSSCFSSLTFVSAPRILVCRNINYSLPIILQDNDEFFELISSKFLSERRYSVSVQAAATRLLFSCSLTWMVKFFSWLFYLKDCFCHCYACRLIHRKWNPVSTCFWRHCAGKSKKLDNGWHNQIVRWWSLLEAWVRWSEVVWFWDAEDLLYWTSCCMLGEVCSYAHIFIGFMTHLLFQSCSLFAPLMVVVVK